MPLQFHSISHGSVAFGFFNIETDLLLLNQYFFFADDFCRPVGQLAGESGKFFETSWRGYELDFKDIGNLMGAIHGVDLRGFIGEVYQIFPFPKQEKDFKQNPNGFRTKPMIAALVPNYGRKITIPSVVDLDHDTITIGEYLFSKACFLELILYVWMGGFPRWKEGIRPDYLVSLREKIDESKNPLFHGFRLNG